MDKDDFKSRINDKNNLFLVAKDSKQLTGFILATIGDLDRPLARKYACIVYIAVSTSNRRRGLGSNLYDECVKFLKKKGVTHLYAWANSSSIPVQGFLNQKGFKSGKKCIWMDKKL